MGNRFSSGTKPATSVSPTAACASFLIFRQEVCVLMRPETAQSGNFCFEVQTPPGLGILPHRHRHEDELVFVIEGVMDFQLDSNLMRLTAGSSLNLPRGSVHGYWNTSDHLARTIWVVSPGAGIEAFFEAIRRFPEGVPDPEQLNDLLPLYGIDMPLPI